MESVQFELVDNVLKAEDFVRLKVATGFIDRPIQQVEVALKNGLFNVSAICDGKVVGMGRLVGDGAMYWYLQEVIVLPEYQGKGIGKQIIETLENDEFFLRAKRIEIPASITACEFYRKMGYDYKDGIKVVDEEQIFRENPLSFDKMGGGS